MSASTIPFEAIDAAALKCNPYIKTILPEAVLNGYEWVCADINGNQGKSFSFNSQTGKWADFATGEKGCGIIALVAKQEGIKQGEAARIVAKGIGYPLEDFKRKPSNTDHGEPSGKPARKELPAWKGSIKDLGDPADRFYYYDENGDYAYEVWRWEPEGFQKVIRPMHRQTVNDKVKYIQGRGNDQPALLYNLPSLIESDEYKPIFIVEGENKVEAIKKYFGRFGLVAVTSGASNSWKDEFNKYFKGKICIILPDNDDAGMKYATTIAKGIKDIANVSYCILDNLEYKEDIVDWISKKQLKEATDEDIELKNLDILWSEIKKYSKPISELPKIEEKKPDTDTAKDVTISQDFVATRIANEHQDHIRYDCEQGKWYIWNSSIWKRDKRNSVLNICRTTMSKLQEDDLVGPKETSASYSQGVKTFLECDPILVVETDIWDKNPDILATPQGTIDLRAGTIREAIRDDYITRQTLVSPDDRTPVRWLQFLNEATQGDTDLQTYLQTICGYFLTGRTEEHALFFVYGNGGNGKSVFLNTLRYILGELAQNAAIQTFMESKYESHPADLAMLQGARLVTASETEQGRAWAESKIKQLTGGDPITARFMRQDFFTYQPKFKLLIIGNNKPVLKNVDDAMRRRLHLIPFTHKPAQPDHKLEQKLKEEAGAILSWMMEGARRWYAEGIKKPLAVVRATENYFTDQDVFTQWLEECCVVGAGNFDTPTNLFKSWSCFCEQKNLRPGTIKTFSERLERDFLKDRTKHGMRFIGLFAKAINETDFQKV